MGKGSVLLRGGDLYAGLERKKRGEWIGFCSLKGERGAMVFSSPDDGSAGGGRREKEILPCLTSARKKRTSCLSFGDARENKKGKGEKSPLPRRGGFLTH